MSNRITDTRHLRHEELPAVLAAAMNRAQQSGQCGIPCIGGDRELLALVHEPLRSALAEARLHSIGSIIKGFALQLPSGDVIMPQTLMDRARKDKRTTRAAALSLAALRLELMPDGEHWTANDWKGFENTQRKKKYVGTSQSQE